MTNLQALRELTNQLCIVDLSTVQVEALDCNVTITVYTGDNIRLQQEICFDTPPTEDILSALKTVCEATLATA